MRPPTRAARRCRHLHRAPSARQHGLSLVELMVGMALGLVIIAAALLALTQQLQASRSLVQEARLMQDLRTTADLMTRDLRRAGHWADAASGVWHAAHPAPLTNPHQDTRMASDTVDFSYSRDSRETNGLDSQAHLGYRLRAGAIDMQLGAGPWQALTDSGTLLITELRITPHTERVTLAELCAQPCPENAAPASTCPPEQVQRRVDVLITARSAHNAQLSHSLQTSVRLRNDGLVGSCPA
jgi:prepilin peptidase dependent protein B